jgi:hypothetical protein
VSLLSLRSLLCRFLNKSLTDFGVLLDLGFLTIVWKFVTFAHNIPEFTYVFMSYFHKFFKNSSKIRSFLIKAENHLKRSSKTPKMAGILWMLGPIVLGNLAARHL